MNMLKIFSVGDEIFGFCNGFFGRDDYADKICVLVSSKYAVFEYEDNTATILHFEKDIVDFVTQWKNKSNQQIK